VTEELLGDLSLFVLALLVGLEVISRIPATLHTPMMSGANSIHGVVLVGAVLLAGVADSPLGYVLTFLAAAFAAMNVVGGYVVTDRMLGMFRARPSRRAAAPGDGTAASAFRASSEGGTVPGTTRPSSGNGTGNGTSRAHTVPPEVAGTER
jgi:H+-translocating NAD(P) transhydrogenase subunit alpha